MGLWDKPGVPHKGWTCVGMIDLGADADGMDFDTRKHELYEQCEMCGQDGVRYVHLMQHSEYPDELRVGCQCAEKMEEDYDSPRRRESKLRNRQLRKVNFLKQQWVRSRNGNFVLKYNGHLITIMKSKFNEEEFGVVYAAFSTWEYREQKIRDFTTAKLAAFDLIDE